MRSAECGIETRASLGERTPIAIPHSAFRIPHSGCRRSSRWSSFPHARRRSNGRCIRWTAPALPWSTPARTTAPRPPGQWQSYDIIFHRPRFASDGAVRDSARVTVLHNGVLVQDNTVITGWTVHGRRAHYQPHADRLPLLLQDHGHPVRYRDIWIRELKE